MNLFLARATPGIGPGDHEMMSLNRSSFRALRIERAMRRPVDMNGSLMSEYGEPPVNGFEPATMRALISNTLNSNWSVTMVSKQNGPSIPREPSSRL